jgi:hypothetical protein
MKALTAAPLSLPSLQSDNCAEEEEEEEEEGEGEEGVEYDKGDDDMIVDYTTLFGQLVLVCVSAGGLFCTAVIAAIIISVVAGGRREPDAELGLLGKIVSKPEAPPFEVEMEQMSTLRAMGVSAQVRRRRSLSQQQEADFGRMYSSI